MKVYPHEKYIFRNVTFMWEWRAAFLHEFTAQYFQLNYLKNCPFGDHYNLALALMTALVYESLA
jgi:hypothetical protein